MIQKQKEKVLKNLTEGINSFRNLDELNDIVVLCKQLDFFEEEKNRELEEVKHLNRHLSRQNREYEYWLFPRLYKKDVARVCKQADEAINEAMEYLGMNTQDIRNRNKVIYTALKAI